MAWRLLHEVEKIVTSKRAKFVLNCLVQLVELLLKGAIALLHLRHVFLILGRDWFNFQQRQCRMLRFVRTCQDSV